MSARPRTPLRDPFGFDRRRLARCPSSGLIVAGADEAGRGCLAGPLVAAAVSLDYSRPLRGILRGVTDSKVLSPGIRESLYELILSAATSVAIVAVSSETIDLRGLHRSNITALGESLRRLGGRYDLALIDGFDLPDDDLACAGLVGGDGRSAAIAAASIVAKVTRDRLMRTLDRRYPGYGFAEHVGYATRAHREALRRLGPCPLHRRSFAGVGTERGPEV
ncbi:MAG: ribonuclease HII [Thermoleophilia bacterium]